MADDIVRTLKAERERLLRRLRAIEKTLEAYGYMANDNVMKNHKKTRTPEDTKRIKSLLRQYILKQENKPVPTRELLDYLENEGLEVGGQRPLTNLSALLSHAKTEFKNVHRKGWMCIGEYPVFEMHEDDRRNQTSDQGQESSPPWKEDVPF